MPRRALDWLRQALRNLRSAEVNFDAELYEEACFESHQAAEKALKALLQSIGVERRGHSLVYLSREAESRGISIPEDIRECLRSLDKHYIPSRYPDVYDEGIPADYYSESDARGCIECARRVVDWVRRHLQEVREA
jgi:HEPN domain-containing protein